MKLISVELTNFRQHTSTRIQFSDGLTGIIGSNGAGKTTILEAIAWALYGAPALRGNNDSVRSRAAEGGKASVTLIFDLGGAVYELTRSLDGRSSSAILAVDGRPVRSGASEVSNAIGALLGMDYQQFFTSFFTGQKQLEFMATLEGRARAAAISRMLGYERLTKARDLANSDRLGLHKEIEGLERGLSDPEELRQRRNEAEIALADAKRAFAEVDKALAAAKKELESIAPLKDASEHKAKLFQEYTRQIESNRADACHFAVRLKQLDAEIVGFEKKRQELKSLAPDLERYNKAAEEFAKLKPLRQYETRRQQLTGQIAALDQAIKQLQLREKQLSNAPEAQMRVDAALVAAEESLRKSEEDISQLREKVVASENALQARIEDVSRHRDSLVARREQIAQAGAEGKCPTCERPLGEELAVVLANLDSQIEEAIQTIESLTQEKERVLSQREEIVSASVSRDRLAEQIVALRKEKTDADARVVELNRLREDLETRLKEKRVAQDELTALPSGFDEKRFQEVLRIGEELKPVREREVALRSELAREDAVRKERADTANALEEKNSEIARLERGLGDLAFDQKGHDELVRKFDHARNTVNELALQLERSRGKVNTAEAVVAQIAKEEESQRSKLDALRDKRSERLHLQAVAEAFDRLRTELNDRIRPELEATASEFLSVMTDGRYNVLEINENYEATIRDDDELKRVISGGEEDVVNLALRLAVSQMIADRAGQSFSLLILDEVFGSLDETRRDNVVSLLRNLKSRFEQIILITHVESVHDAVDNCIWVKFDEKTKTSRLISRSEYTDCLTAGAILEQVL